ncbi:MAG: hypothetical protein DBX97_04175, partial [Collinsella tanakaei]
MTRSARVFAVGRDAAGTEFKAVITATPNTYTNDAGEEATIDNTLVAAADGAYENAANDMKIDIPADPASTGVSVTANGYTVSLAPLEGDFSRPVVEENAIRFNDVLDGIDIQYTAKEMVLKEDIILLRPVERSAFRYRLDAPGLEARMKDGVLALYKPGTDEAVFTILAPVMTDAAGAASHELSVSLAEENGVQIVTVTADAAWLADPERVYPVLIDPSVQNTYKANASMLTVGNSHYEHGGGYAVAGYAPKSMCGYPNEIDWSINRTLLYFKDVTSVLPENGEIDKAELVLHEYQSLSGGSTGFLVGQLDSRLEYSDVNSHPNYSNHWDFVQAAAQHTVGSFRSQAGTTHKIDITETVNNWQKGIDPNYGLMLWTDGESTGTLGSRFYPGQGTEADIPPCIEVTWHEVGDVSSSYPLDDTTILLRPISASDRSGKLEFYGVFWDGVATPKSTLTYRLNVEEKNYTGSMTPGFDYLYPSTEAFEAAFPAGSNKYRRRLSNWQTPLPFMDFDYDTVYFLTAQASKDGTAGAEKTSDTFLVYQVKQFDTISKIASHYGVDYNTLLVDNRTVDGLLVENNTLFIRNPKVTEPYNPAPLTDEDKTKIDTYLVGRGLHCEFGFEPINLNTGNFYLSSEDAVIKDAGGAFVLERSYNSKTAGYNSIFGRGWAFTYDESLGKTADGAMAYRRGDGSTAYFEPDGSGGYISPAGEHLQLTALPTETKEINFGTDEDPDIQTFQLYEYEIKEQDGTVRRFNSQGLLVSVTDPQGRVTQLAYDSAFALSSITLPGGQALSIVTDSQNRITEIGLPSGAALKYAYDDAGNLISYTNGNGEATTYSYDGSHQMISWFDANGTAMVTNTYDGEGRVVKQLDGEGHAAELRYEDGKTTATDENGNVTVYHYDGQYRTTRIDYPDGISESFEYDAGNHRSAFVDGLGNRTAYEYDAAGNLVKQTRFDGASQSYTWNAQNKPTSFTDYDGATTLYEYSAAGDLVKTTYADGTATEVEYDAAHNPVKITDALGSSTQLEYAGGQLVKVIDPAGGVYSFSYDAMGNLTGVTDPEGGVSRTEYDGAGRVTAEQDASGGWTRYELDAGGRLLAQTDAGGNRVSFTYDKAD